MKKLSHGEIVQIIDTREPDQYAAGHLSTAQNIAHADLRNQLGLLDQTRSVVTCCNQ